MNRFMSAIIIANVLLPAGRALAKTYYVSAAGDDGNDGVSETSSWRTVGRVNRHGAKPGDSIFFRGGDTFTDAGLYFGEGTGGDSGNPARIGSYGGGRAVIKPSPP